MRVKGMLGAEVAALVTGMRPLCMGAGRAGSGASGEEPISGGQDRKKSATRKVLREESIVFAAVALAYVLAWAASRVFQQ